MAQQESEFLGVSPPLSTEMPKPRDTELYESLMAELKAQNNFEAPEQTQKRLVLCWQHENGTLLMDG